MYYKLFFLSRSISAFVPNDDPCIANNKIGTGSGLKKLRASGGWTLERTKFAWYLEVEKSRTGYSHYVGQNYLGRPSQ